jgi:hypothetical protein
MRRDVLVALCAVCSSLAFASSAAASWLPTPPDPRPPDANPHAVYESTTGLHMGDAELMAANSSGTFQDFASRYGATTDGTTAWTGTWYTRPNKPAPGDPRTMQTTVYWYRTDLRVYCSYSGTAAGTDTSMTGAFYLDFCSAY